MIIMSEHTKEVQMTNLEWIKSMDAEQMIRDVLIACDHYRCKDCPVKPACFNRESALKWLREKHQEDKG